MRMLALMCRYGTEKYPSAYEELSTFLDSRFGGLSKSVLVVDNAKPRAFRERLSPDRVLVGGDNSLYEFSGWQTAIASEHEFIAEHDLVLLATEAFTKDYVDYLSLFDEHAAEAAVEGSLCFGHLDAYPEPVTLLGQTSRSWLRSCMLLMSVDALKRITPLVVPEILERFFTDDIQHPFSEQARICDRYQGYLLGWLTGKGLFTGGVYHSQFDLSRETVAHFRRKAACIIHEHHVTLRLETAGITPIDIEWWKRLDTGLGAGDLVRMSRETQLKELEQLRSAG